MAKAAKSENGTVEKFLLGADRRDLNTEPGFATRTCTDRQGTTRHRRRVPAYHLSMVGNTGLTVDQALRRRGHATSGRHDARAPFRTAAARGQDVK